MPRVENIALNGVVLTASIAILTLTGLIAALLPASQAWRSDLTSASREDNRATAGSLRQSRARNFLVVTQIALALPLLTGGILLTRSFNSLTAIHPGFNADGVLSRAPRDPALEVSRRCGDRGRHRAYTPSAPRPFPASSPPASSIACRWPAVRRS